MEPTPKFPSVWTNQRRVFRVLTNERRGREETILLWRDQGSQTRDHQAQHMQRHKIQNLQFKSAIVSFCLVYSSKVWDFTMYLKMKSNLEKASMTTPHRNVDDRGGLRVFQGQLYPPVTVAARLQKKTLKIEWVEKVVSLLDCIDSLALDDVGHGLGLDLCHDLQHQHWARLLTANVLDKTKRKVMS